MESRRAAAAAALFVCLLLIRLLLMLAHVVMMRSKTMMNNIYIDLTIYSSLISRLVRNVWVSGVQRVGIWE